jgi:hypothetical protein
MWLMKKNGWLLLFMFVLLALFYFVPGETDDAFSQKTVQALVIDTTPTCLDRSNIPAEEWHWLYIPSDPSELETSEYYGYLSGQLIQAGVVDASECPLGGLWPNGFANSCGLEKAYEVAIYLQNVYDEDILAAGINTGTPPVMLKQLMRQESQFWPIRTDAFHYGLGHVTYVGVMNGLMWNPTFYQEICEAINNGPCPHQSFNSTRDSDLLLASTVLAMMDASCPDCEYAIDIPKAKRSVSYIAQIVFGYCRQTSQVIYNATDEFSNQVVDYATIWKLTLLNYNAGPLCVYNAVKASYDPKNPGKITWGQISSRTTSAICRRGVLYVDAITAPYYNFGPPPQTP